MKIALKVWLFARFVVISQRKTTKDPLNLP